MGRFDFKVVFLANVLHCHGTAGYVFAILEIFHFDKRNVLIHTHLFMHCILCLYLHSHWRSNPQEERFRIPLTVLIPQHLCACPIAIT